jgi:hypothetical protein
VHSVKRTMEESWRFKLGCWKSRKAGKECPLTAWAAIEVAGEELDWFELAIAEMESKEKEDVMEEFRDTSGHVLIATKAADSSGTTKLYDSGCTNHIFPYRQKFENFVRIPPSPPRCESAKFQCYR